MEIARPARERVLNHLAGRAFEPQCKACQMEGIISSIDNPKTFPFIREAVRGQGMKIFGIYFDLEQGELLHFDEDLPAFKLIELRSELVVAEAMRVTSVLTLMTHRISN